jgi:hypothetical protein
MTGLFVELMRRHFADSDNIEHAVFRNRLYTTADSTGILIEDATHWKPQNTQKRPGIVVKRNGWKHLKRLAFGNKTGVNEEGHTEYVTLWRGSHTLFCIAPEGAEAEILTAESYRFLMHFAQVFRRYFKLLMFEVMDVGPLSRVEEADKHYAVPITVAYGWAESWIVREHVPPLTDVRLSQIFETYYGSN